MELYFIEFLKIERIQGGRDCRNIRKWKHRRNTDQTKRYSSLDFTVICRNWPRILCHLLQALTKWYVLKLWYFGC